MRDQITSVREYSGNANGTENCPTATCQITTMDYDGHGRLWKQRRPIETADNVYLYNADDTLWKHTDPRNVTATYTYNNRKLTTGIAFDSMPNAVLPSQLPSRPIPSANVTFGYDQVGNRIWMDDAPGRVDYVYDQLDRLKEETRLFDASAVSRSFTLKYDYNLAGQLKQITDPWNAVVNYNMDKSGQETGITATGYKDVNQWTNRTVGTFASNIKYRAWGGIKQFSNGTLSGNSSFAMGYDARLRLTSFTGGNRTTQQTYYDDGLVKEVTDLHYGSNFLRKYEYDHVSQLKQAHAGGTAQTSSSPYSLTYGYDVWGHTTSRTGSHWSNALTAFSTTFTDDRDDNMTFDAAGNVKGYTTSNDPYMHYNAASQLFTQFESGTLGLVRVRENYYDGDGAKVFYKTFNGSENNGSYSLFCDYFLIRSSVLGGRVLAEFKDLTTYAENDPLKYSSKSYVYLKGVQLGFQMDAHKATGDKFVAWMYHNPTVGNYFAEYQLNNSGGQQVNFPYGEMTFDPLGSYVGLSESQPIDVPSPFTFVMGQFMEASTGKCYADYVETRCEVVQQMLNNGTGNYAPLNNTDSVYNPITKRNELALFTVDWDNGFFGFVPTGANYNGDGSWSWTRPSSGRPTLNPRGAHEIIYGRGYYPEPTQGGNIQQIRDKIASLARGYVGSTLWLESVEKSGVAAGNNKCNTFVNDVIVEAGGIAPRVPYKNEGGLSALKTLFVRPPNASEWGDPNIAIPGWEIVRDGSVRPGDVVAVNRPDSTGHVGIYITVDQLRNGKAVASANAHASPKGIITDTAWGFRWGEEDSKLKIIRRYVGRPESGIFSPGIPRDEFCFLR